MALSAKHKFTSPKVDGPDTTLVRPSNWNDEHDITVTARSIVGKTTTGTGPAEQINVSSTVLSLLQAADAATICTLLGLTPPRTGDAQLTMQPAAPAGWLMVNDGTIGNVSSGASTRANNDTQALFTLIWENISNTYAPVYAPGTSSLVARGVSAAADWAANRHILTSQILGRALAIAGNGASLTARALGTYVGAETHTLNATQIPVITPSGSVATNLSLNGVVNAIGVQSYPVGTDGPATSVTAYNPIAGGGYYSFSATSAFSGATWNPSGGQAHNIMQPTAFAFRVMIKL